MESGGIQQRWRTIGGKGRVDTCSRCLLQGPLIAGLAKCQKLQNSSTGFGAIVSSISLFLLSVSVERLLANQFIICQILDGFIRTFVQLHLESPIFGLLTRTSQRSAFEYFISFPFPFAHFFKDSRLPKLTPLLIRAIASSISSFKLAWGSEMAARISWL